MRWGVERRLEFIEFRLFWEGGINRADITNFFGVSTLQASKDLSQYQEIAPENVWYDKSGKKYVVAKKFNPRLFVPDADRYLAQLTAITSKTVKKEETWLGELPSFDAMPIPHRRVSVEILRSLQMIIRNQSSVEVEYQSMSEHRTTPIWRRITPHAFASDGLRWHVRAYCHIDNKYKDFVLSRCLGTREIDRLGATADDDRYWNEYFSVVLTPNPKLGKNQQRVIEQDYEMKEGVAEVPIRRALLYYFSKRLRLDIAGKVDKPHETPVVVKNRIEYDIALAEAML